MGLSARASGPSQSTAVFLLKHPEIPIESLERYSVSRWSLEVLNIVLNSRLFENKTLESYSRYENIKYENGSTARRRPSAPGGLQKFGFWLGHDLVPRGRRNLPPAEGFRAEIWDLGAVDPGLGPACGG